MSYVSPKYYSGQHAKKSSPIDALSIGELEAELERLETPLHYYKCVERTFDTIPHEEIARPFIEPTPHTYQQLFRKRLPDGSYPWNYGKRTWNDGIWGYLQKTKDENVVLTKNMKLGAKYSHAAVLIFDEIIAVWKIKKVYWDIYNTLTKNGLSAYWTMEVKPANNTVHWNFVFRDGPSVERIKEVLRTIGQGIDRRLWVVETYGGHRGIQTWLDYILKAKSKDNQRKTKDRYWKDRVLFAPRLGLRKTGQTKTFFVGKKTELKKDRTTYFCKWYDEHKEQKKKYMREYRRNKNLSRTIDAIC